MIQCNCLITYLIPSNHLLVAPQLSVANGKMKITILNEQISKDKLYYKLDTLEVISLTLCSYLSTTQLRL